jgi:hypothetical protein
MPSLEILEIKSGRTPEKIRAGLQELAEDNYILWEFGKPLESAVVVEGWERTEDRPASVTWGLDGGYTSYWTDY